MWGARTWMRPGGRIDFLSTQKKELMSGDFVRVSVTGAVEYDLTGEAYAMNLPNKLTILRVILLIPYTFL